MAIATIPGFPRIGRNRELKRALERRWSGKQSNADLLATGANIRAESWKTQQQAGLDLLPVNDFSYYDQVLDTAVLLGAVPDRFGWSGDTVDLDTYFAMARGRTGDFSVSAMEMTKWFDTNYHYIVPELSANQTVRLTSTKPFDETAEALSQGVAAKPVLVGPLTFLLLSKGDDVKPLALLDSVLPVYRETIERLAALGVSWIQLDEPALVQDRTPDELALLAPAYQALASAKGSAKLLVQTAFGDVGDALPVLTELPIDGIGLDLVRGAKNLDLIETHGIPESMWVSAGVVDGRNVWVNDLNASLAILDRLRAHVPSERLMVSASCSLLHVPYDTRLEEDLDPTVLSWLAFAEQKLAEIVLLTRGVNEGRTAIQTELAANQQLLETRRTSPLLKKATVQDRLANITDAPAHRSAPYAERAVLQQQRLKLPPLPTTTIGSFPQTGEVRAMRKRFESGQIDLGEYESFLEQQIREVIAFQEKAELDVLVHGEPERNDMVQYFGEQLDGFAFTRHGWVQSYGSRCVRPPIIFGDVHRPEAMTVRWAMAAQSMTNRPVKGMLTGPVTILNWSFVRDDQPRETTCRQIALAIRDEVEDLDQAGIAVIQIDEPALREGLPLRQADWDSYLDWATDCFRLAASSARPETQVHTHMCYSEFGDVIGAISALDADVISIENARSGLELLDVFRTHGYDKGVGPGIYDIHSPRVPPVEEMVQTIQSMLTVLDTEQVWVNPDCGLKTRTPDETERALVNMVAATRIVRETLV